MKNTVKYLAIMVVVLTVSSAIFAAQGGNSKNCSGVTTTDGATWGGGGSGPLKASSSPTGTCTGTQVTLSTNQTRSERGNGIAHAFGKILAGLKGSLETATWGGGGGLPGR